VSAEPRRFRWSQTDDATAANLDAGSIVQNTWRIGIIPKPLQNRTSVRLFVGRASRLPSNNLRPQAGRLRYISKVQMKADFGIRDLLQKNHHEEGAGYILGPDICISHFHEEHVYRPCFVGARSMSLRGRLRTRQAGPSWAFSVKPALAPSLLGKDECFAPGGQPVPSSPSSKRTRLQSSQLDDSKSKLLLVYQIPLSFGLLLCSGAL
jgi:hypothetical protein